MTKRSSYRFGAITSGLLQPGEANLGPSRNRPGRSRLAAGRARQFAWLVTLAKGGTVLPDGT